MSHKLLFVLLVCVTGLFAADAFALNLFGGNKFPKSIDYTVVGNDLAPYTQLTSEQSNALLALEAKLRGHSSKKVKKKLGVVTPDELFPESEKLIKSLVVEEVALFDATSTTDLAGFMRFADGSGRNVEFWFVMALQKNTNLAIDVQALDISTSSGVDVELFVVPEDKINAATIIAVNDYAKLYKEIGSIALANNASMSSTENYIAVAFFKELIAPGMQINMKLADTQEGPAGLAYESRYKLVEDAWLVTMLPLNKNAMRDNKWVKITQQAKSSAYPDELNEERVIRLFQLNQ